MSLICTPGLLTSVVDEEWYTIHEKIRLIDIIK